VEPYLAMTDLDWAGARLVAPDRYEGTCRVERRRSAVPPAAYAAFAAAYQQVKRTRGVLDFDDLLLQLLQALRTDAAWADAMQWRYRHFFVDEAQDLNPLQHAVLEALRNNRPDLCLVGDPRQAIYGWNGADHTTLSEVQHRYPGITQLALTGNYRCSPQVVRAAAAALGAAGQSDDTVSLQPGGAAVAVREFATEADEAEGIARHMRDLLHHHRGRDLAVLARTNEQLSTLQRAFAASGIATEQTAGRSPLDLATATAFRCANRELLAEWVDGAFEGGDELLRRVAEEADRFLTSGESGTFRAWVDARSPFDDLDTTGDSDAVALLTFHAAKGREWWGVVVAGAEDGLVPHASAVSPAQLAEEARLFYVAITRAAQHLLITHASTRNQRSAGPSRWLLAVQEAALEDLPAAPPSRPRRPADPLPALREWRAAVARVSGQPERAVCSDRVLRSLAEQPPASVGELAQRLGITESAAAQLRPLPRSPVTV
jgi:DNA helicase-2/ATP-dependent DNA helicase PcrA